MMRVLYQWKHPMAGGAAHLNRRLVREHPDHAPRVGTHPVATRHKWERTASWYALEELARLAEGGSW